MLRDIFTAWFRKLFGKGGDKAAPERPPHEQTAPADSTTSTELEDTPGELGDPEPSPV